jgi:hypothetical protein
MSRLAEFSPFRDDAEPDPPPPTSWRDWWPVGLGLLVLAVLLALGALLSSAIIGAQVVKKLDSWPSPSSAATSFPSPSSASTRPPTPTPAATRYPSFSSFPTPSPSCGCCAQCNSEQAYECTCCQFCPDCAGQLSLALGTVTTNIVTKLEANNIFPPDTIMAVGNNDDEGRIIAVVNGALVILNKATHARILIDDFFFGNGAQRPGDPYVTWDATSNRFFLTGFRITSCAQELNVLTPPAIAGPKCNGVARFGPLTFNLTGPVEIASPLDACIPPLNNLTGKIALIIRGVCPFQAKVKNVQNAGAIGAIVYNNLNTGLINMIGVDPTIVIPSVFVTDTDGLAITTNLPATALLTTSQPRFYNTTIFIAVSNTSTPNTRADFTHYTVSDGAYVGSVADYPKHSTDKNALYISTQNFGDFQPSGFAPCIGPNIRAFDKNALIAGAGVFTLWDTVLPGDGISNPLFVFPAELRTPISNQFAPMFFVGLNTGNGVGKCDVGGTPTPVTSLRIFAGTAGAGIWPIVGEVPFPTPMTFGVCMPSTANCTYAPSARQPLPAVPDGLDALLNFVTTGVVFNDRLYTAVAHNVSAEQTVARWFEIDVAPMALFQQPVLLQWGDLNISPDIDTFMPHIDITEDGTMGIAFYVSGPEQPVTAVYTVRIATDAPNSIRTPFHRAVPNNYTFFNSASTNSRNRYGDYVGLQVDPVDRHTFYAFTQRPDPLGLFNPPGFFGPCLNASACVARDWTTDLFMFSADIDTCPTDGIATQPEVLAPQPSASSAHNFPPADPADFVIPQTENCVFISNRVGYACLE